MNTNTAERAPLDVKIVPYMYLPCELDIFTIDGRPAYVHDFGTSACEDFSTEEIEQDPYCTYGCKNRSFNRNFYVDNKVLEKYSITKEEYEQIGKLLQEKLYIGDCGLCV